MNDSLAGRTAVVTGTSQGIGEAVAWRFAAEGARLVLSELTDDLADAMDAVADKIATAFPASGVIATVTDVSDPAACDALMDAAVERHGRLDVVAHATAVGQQPGPVAQMSPREWDRVIAINATGPFLLARSAIPRLARPGGSIVFTGSWSGLAGQADNAAYCASKGALRLLTQSLALELAADGIRVNGVAPAFVESALVRQRAEDTAAREGITVAEVVARRDAGIPVGRQARAEEVAEAFAFLAGPQSSYVTGTWLDVTGGMVLR